MKLRELSAATSTAIARDVTKPGFLCELALASQTIRISSRGPVAWNGLQFIDMGFDVRGIATTGGQEAQAGSLVIDDGDLTMSTMILSDGIADRPVKIWAFYGDTDPAALDPFAVFNGVANDAQIDTATMKVTISLLHHRISTSQTPRVYMTHENGFRFLPPRGTVLSWGGENFELTGE